MEGVWRKFQIFARHNRQLHFRVLRTMKKNKGPLAIQRGP
jgi:hypothetical protein